MFTMSFPLYFIADKSFVKVDERERTTVDEKTAFYGGRTVDGSFFFAVFKSASLAERYIKDYKLSQFDPAVVQLPNAESFVSLLEQPSFKLRLIGFNPGIAGMLNQDPLMETQVVLTALRNAINKPAYLGVH